MAPQKEKKKKAQRGMQTGRALHPCRERPQKDYLTTEFKEVTICSPGKGQGVKAGGTTGVSRLY